MIEKNKWIKNKPINKEYFIEDFICINCFKKIEPDIVKILVYPKTEIETFDGTASYALAQKVWKDECLKDEFTKSKEVSKHAKWDFNKFIETEFFKKEKLKYLIKEGYFSVVSICTNSHCNFANTFLALEDYYSARPTNKHKLYIEASNEDDFNDLNDCVKNMISSYVNGNYLGVALIARKFLIELANKLGEPVVAGKKFYVYANFLKRKVEETKSNILHKIIQEGNIANHELKRYNQKDASYLLELVKIIIDNLFYVPKYIKAKNML